VVPAPAGLLRRLGAMLYDSLLVLALLAILIAFIVPFTDGAVLVPAEIGWLAYLFRATQLVVIVLFLGYFWTRRGQTIGMLAWRLRITRSDGSPLRWGDALRRLVILGVLWLPLVCGDWLLFSRWQDARWRWIAVGVSLLPLVGSYLWVCIDREHRAWHDRWSGTRMWVLPKRG
jgi:uncharacterized RDD family membrane protein YckC